MVLHDWRRGAQYYSDHTGTASAGVNVAGVGRRKEISLGDVASGSQIRPSSIKGLSKDVIFWAALSHRLLGGEFRCVKPAISSRVDRTLGCSDAHKHTPMINLSRNIASSKRMSGGDCFAADQNEIQMKRSI